VASLSGSGSEIRGVVCDVADPASVDAAAKATFSAFGKVHIHCNNAGVGALGGIDHIALDDWRWVLDVNLIGVVNGVRALLPHMRAHGEGGHIVNTASMAGIVNSPQAGGQGFAPYPATKYAVVGMSEGLAAELKPFGIGVTVVCPGNSGTSGRGAVVGLSSPSRHGPEVYIRTEDRIPLDYLLKPPREQITRTFRAR